MAVKHTSCPKCGSKDNLAVQDNGYQKCYTPNCGYYAYGTWTSAKVETPMSTIVDINETVEYKEVKSRGLTAKTAQFYNYGTGSNSTGPFRRLEYKDTTTGVTRFKYKTPETKGLWKGPKITPQLFGQDKFQSGGKWLLIHEGEEDAMAAYQMFDGNYCCVSIPNGIQGATKDILNNYKFVDSFEKVVICFDTEPAAQEIAHEVATLFDYGKVFIAVLPLKDANDMLMARRVDEFKKAIWNAKEFKPDLTITANDITSEEWKSLFVKGFDIHYPKLNSLIKGIRQKAVYILAAAEKTGKTSVVMELCYNLLKQGKKIAYIPTEESAVDILAKLGCIHNNIPFHLLQDMPESNRPEKEAFIPKFVTDNLVLYNPSSIKLSDIITNMKYMALALKVDLIMFDNISICDEANESDTKSVNKYFINMVQLAKDTKVPIITVVHLAKNRKDKNGADSTVVNASDIYGTGAYAKFCHVVMAVEKDPESPTSVLKVIRNRTTGVCGYADRLKYDTNTGRLSCE